MKKLLLTLGTVAAVAAPVTSVIACGSSDKETKPAIKKLTTGFELQLASPATPTEVFPARYEETKSTTFKEKVDYLFAEGLISEAQHTGWFAPDKDDAFLARHFIFTYTEITTTNPAYILKDGATVKPDGATPDEVADPGEYYFPSIKAIATELENKTPGHFYYANNLTDNDVAKLLAPFASELAA